MIVKINTSSYSIPTTTLTVVVDLTIQENVIPVTLVYNLPAEQLGFTKLVELVTTDLGIEVEL